MKKTDPNETPLDGTGGNASAREIMASQMFAVAGHEATLSNLNTRSEKHGDDDVPAADVKLVLVGPHSLLKPFGESLIDFLFREPGVGEDVQGALDLGGDRRTKVRHPKIKPLQHTDEFPGYVVTLSAGLETSTPQVSRTRRCAGLPSARWTAARSKSRSRCRSTPTSIRPACCSDGSGKRCR